MSDNRKKIYFYEEINFLNMIMALLFLVLGSKIYFRLKSKNIEKFFISNFLTKRFFYQISLNDEKFARRIFNDTFKFKKKLFHRFYNKNLSNDFVFNYFLTKFEYLNDNVKKFKLCVQEEFEKGEINLEISSYILIKKKFLNKQFRVNYFPRSYKNYMLLEVLKHKNFKIYYPILQVILIDLVILLFFNIFNKIVLASKNIFLTQRKKDKKDTECNFDQYKFAYFPHGKSLKYGHSFKKDFIYDKDINSELYQKKVLTIWLENNIEKSTLLFLKRKKIPFVIYTNKITKNFIFSILLPTIFFILKKNKKYIFTKKCFLNAILILNVFRKIHSSKKFLKQFKNLKYLYVFYDILFPRFFLFTANILGIQTISSQERINGYLYTAPLFFNYYFVTGNFFKKKFTDEGYIVDKYFNLGMPRSSLIKENKVKLEFKKYLSIKKNKKIILCLFLFLHPVDEKHLNIVGNVGVSYASNVNFFKAIIKLSKKFNDCHFVIIGKDKISKDDMIKIYPEISKELIFGNIEIADKCRSYELAYLADLTIGKRTTLMEEILCSRRKILFYDTEGNFINMDYDIKNTGLIANNYQELESMFERYIKDENYFSDKVNYFINNYLISDNKKQGYSEFKKNIKKIFDENKLLSDRKLN